MNDIDLMQVLRDAKASDAGMPFPSGVPEALQIPSQKPFVPSPSNKTPVPDSMPGESIPPPPGPAEGGWFSLDLCDGSTIEVWKK